MNQRPLLLLCYNPDMNFDRDRAITQLEEHHAKYMDALKLAGLTPSQRSICEEEIAMAERALADLRNRPAVDFVPSHPDFGPIDKPPTRK